ncbi:DUF5665 domain-containing protein [Syntrophomonas wolfei]|uniref:Uncharacterized protein n=1 Tax=Syntrophomonas wolfei subsp. wolfei (strain DSM 2245B / Goettingen) TaxID=335541 RepID=Q0AYC6_SYNWW|nr:DUF5665 domain-containing protein [Syntrophomonas wolfei]ABI68278.1 conserved hypothetical protein [Syntrophomonas wolfei subsp. wolfei str. Goettingen G311]
MPEREPGRDDSHYLQELNRKMDELSLNMEKLGIAEYLEMLRNPRRLFFINFWAGLSRGFGMAIGFTILAAIVIYFLQKLIILNVPLIGDFIADLVAIVQNQLRVQ